MKFLRNILLFSLLLLPRLAKASLAESLGLSKFGDRTNLVKPEGENVVQDIITKILNILLSFLGMLFTLLIIYGGFKWMLSRGNSQQVEEAKEVIKHSSIGLGIVLLSYIIVRTVFMVLNASRDEYPEGFIGPIP
ncbi:MAG: pilin [bacterium]|nr:pilin [bacterium]